MGDEALDGIIRLLLADAAVTAKVSARIYATHTSLVPSVGYPCLTVLRERPALALSGVPAMRSSVTVTAHSERDTSEAWAIGEAVAKVLDHVQGLKVGEWWCLQLESGRFVTVDDSERPVFRVHATYRVVETR